MSRYGTNDWDSLVLLLQPPEYWKTDFRLFTSSVSIIGHIESTTLLWAKGFTLLSAKSQQNSSAVSFEQAIRVISHLPN